MTVTICALGADSVTVNVSGTVPVFPSACDAPPMESDCSGSSFVIVPVPLAAVRVAAVAPESTTMNVSSNSFTASATTGMLMVCVSVPGVNVRLPLVFA